MPKAYEPATIFILAPGAFFVLAFLAAIRAKLQDKKPEGERHDLPHRDQHLVLQGFRLLRNLRHNGPDMYRPDVYKRQMLFSTVSPSVPGSMSTPEILMASQPPVGISP